MATEQEVQFGKQETAVLLRELRGVLGSNIPGDVVEFGCYDGVTSVAIARTLRDTQQQRTLYLYDSFEGLPKKTIHDYSPAGTQFIDGELKTSKDVVIRRFKQAGLPLPVIHRGWFNALQVNDMPEQVSFAFLDGDYYESIRDSLRLIWNALTPGSVIVIDDYQNEALPGVAKAVTEWLQKYPAAIRSEASLAIIRRR